SVDTSTNTPVSGAYRMGSFMGHVVPGFFFYIFSVWWTWKIFHKFFLCQRAQDKKGRSRYLNTASFPSNCCTKRVPLESILKIVAVILGMAGELATAFVDGKFVYLVNAQHMTMFFFFGLSGVMDLLNHYQFPFPPDLDYVSAVLAFTMEGLLFFYHLHGRAGVDVQVHMLLFYVICACAVSTALEMKYKKNVLPALARTYFTMLQGTWFLQVGFILYPPVGDKWDEESHRNMMFVTLYFAWHNAAIFIAMALTGTLIYFRIKRMDGRNQYHNMVTLSSSMHPNLNKFDAQQVRNIIADSDEEEV
ncbi:unnamed protein product, partial [Meganyctiphanes norvegica]